MSREEDFKKYVKSDMSCSLCGCVPMECDQETDTLRARVKELEDRYRWRDVSGGVPETGRWIDTCHEYNGRWIHASFIYEGTLRWPNTHWRYRDDPARGREEKDG